MRAAAGRVRRALGDYPWDAVLLATMVVVIIVVLGSFALDALWAARWLEEGRPAAAAFRDSCYWMGDNRILVNIARNGYSDYSLNYQSHHITNLPDRSWWPLFVNLTALALRLTGGNYCAGWLVNLAAMALLVPVVQALTGTRRPSLLIGVALLPFGVWLYAGLAEGMFLLLSGLLLWVSLRRTSPRRGGNLTWGALALALGVLIGLTKPNALALLPGLIALALSRTADHLRATSGNGPRWQRALDDGNPGWPALLGSVGIALGLGAWLYHASGYYPLYPILLQRTLWYKEFPGGNVLAFLNYLTESWRTLVEGRGLPYPPPRDTVEFAALALAGIVTCRDLPPRWPGARRRRPTPLYQTIGVLSVFGLVFVSGQAHAVERYLIGNVFFLVAFLRYVYGDEDEPPLTALPGVVRARGTDSLRAALRLTVFACSLLLMGIEIWMTLARADV